MACSGYPECKTSKPLSIGVACPTCKVGYLTERRTRRGKVFFGCNRYPDCTFAAWDRPLPRHVRSAPRRTCFRSTASATAPASRVPTRSARTPARSTRAGRWHPQRGLRRRGEAAGPARPRRRRRRGSHWRLIAGRVRRSPPHEPGDRPPWRGSGRRLRAHAPPSQSCSTDESGPVAAAQAPTRPVPDAADAARFPGRRTDVAPDPGTVATGRREARAWRSADLRVGATTAARGRARHARERGTRAVPFLTPPGRKGTMFLSVFAVKHRSVAPP
jgi:hypothetical protein